MNKKFNNKIRLDLFKIHDSKDNTDNWILAKGKNLESELKELINKTKYSNTELVKYLMKKLNISITTSERLVYLKREWYPLIFIKEIVNLTKSSKYKIQDNIEYLKSSKPKVVEYKAVKELTINLCKIVGAHAADGTICDSYICISDSYRDNILALINWFKEFDYHPRLDKIDENQYCIRFHSRIISRYLIKLFDFPSGCKQYTVEEPDIIKDSSLEFRKAFTIGVLTFEAGIGIKNQIEFCVVSKKFRDSIVDILNELNIYHKAMNRKSSGYWRFWSNHLTKEEALKWIELFESNTEKWFKLDNYINGFSKKVNSFNEAIQILDSIYPRKSPSKIILKDVLLALKKLKKTYRYELADYLAKENNLKSFGGRWAHSLKHYLDILKATNIISVKMNRFGPKKSFGTIIRETYIFNENIKDWKLPHRDNLKII